MEKVYDLSDFSAERKSVSKGSSSMAPNVAIDQRIYMRWQLLQLRTAVFRQSQ